MKKNTLILLFLIFLSYSISAQQIVKKQIEAIRIDQPLKIDGILDEPGYKIAPKAADFFQLNPFNGKPSYEQTEVQIFYDDNALYIGAMLYDNPDSIRSYVTTRDNLGSSDYFDVCIDPNNEGLIAYEFAVTPANSQTDIKAIKLSGFDNEDGSWDAVWQSATKINEHGWAIEYRIPYSALRFPEKDEMVWGINFFRRIRRYTSNNSWNRVHNEISGFIQQSGELHGLKNIKAPIRLSISPYVAGYAETNSTTSEVNFLYKGGLDLKYGLSKSHTLDMMLIPDFGQIQSDDEELNLTPFEVYYDEKRQFFIEGVELFNRGEIFYSRRIGGMPMFHNLASDQLDENEKITFNPTETQMANATKISGRNSDGWGIGFLNAMTLKSDAEITNTITNQKRLVTVQPFTNYNVSVIEKALKNSSYVSVINTNISMINNPYSANVTATEFQFKNNEQTHQFSGNVAASIKKDGENESGYKYELDFRKTKGKFRYTLQHELISKDYNPNDLGYLRRNNIEESEIQFNYNIYDPFFIFKNVNSQISFTNVKLHDPNKLIGNEIESFTGAQFKNNLWFGVYYQHNFGQNDYFETRVEDRFYQLPSHDVVELNFSSDNNLKLSGSFSGGFYNANTVDINGFWINGNIWWKVNQKLAFMYSANNSTDYNLEGYVNHFSNDSILFGRYNRNTFTNNFNVSYNFNTKMALDFRLRHYWSWADYDNIYLLNNNGNLGALYAYDENADINFNAFNIDMTFKWELAPGSLLSLVWKNSIYDSNDQIGLNYRENISNTFNATQSNSISLKLLYYIDLNTVVNRNK